MNFDYKILSDPELSLTFIEENLSKFTKAEFNIISIFNKHISKEFREAYQLYPWAHYDFETKLMETRSMYPPNYAEINKENRKKLIEKLEKITSKK